MPIDSPLITTILPTYRRPHLLKRAIESVLRQTFRHFQLCIYDNASGDQTAEVVAKVAQQDRRVKYFCHTENIGSLANFSHGLSRVDTPFFSILSDDDILLPNFYETALSKLKQFPDAIFFAGSTITMNERGKVLAAPLDLWPREGYYAPPEGIFEMMDGQHPTWTGILFRSDVIEKAGTLDHAVAAPSDLDYELRVAARFPFVLSKTPCAILLIHPQAYSKIAAFDAHWPGWRKLIKNLSDDPCIAEAVRIRAERQLSARAQKILFDFGIKSIENGSYMNTFKAAKILRQEFRANIRSRRLTFTARLCEKYPFIHKLFVLFLDVKSSYPSRKNRSLQSKYGKLAQWL